jgi:hypothetical protein
VAIDDHATLHLDDEQFVANLVTMLAAALQS